MIRPRVGDQPKLRSPDPVRVIVLRHRLDCEHPSTQCKHFRREESGRFVWSLSGHSHPSAWTATSSGSGGAPSDCPRRPNSALGDTDPSQSLRDLSGTHLNAPAPAPRRHVFPTRPPPPSLPGRGQEAACWRGSWGPEGRSSLWPGPFGLGLDGATERGSLRDMHTG